ncbi:large ribosomal subunit protein eL13y-like [Bidens hawaiensis]|uniref:large ribosomal subunit protein eL13y-like n=1 Tax=Bidens hawaiensis TaxID=980011 RepID=UPI00404996D9
MHNNAIPNGHFKKHWQNYVKNLFNLANPSAKHGDTTLSKRKAVKVFPRPAGKLRPQASARHQRSLQLILRLKVQLLPIVREKPAVEFVKVTEKMKSFNAYATLCAERTKKRHLGARLKKAAGGRGRRKEIGERA